MFQPIKNKKALIIVDQMIVSATNFILGVLLARQLGGHQYGIFTLIWMPILFFSSIQLAFIISPMLTLGSKKSPAILPKYLSAMTKLQFCVSFLSIISLLIFFKISGLINIKWNIGYLGIYISIFCPIFLFQDFLRRYFILKTSFITLITIDCIAYIGTLILLIILLNNNMLSLKTTLLALIISFLISILVSLTQITKTKIKFLYFKLIFKKNWNFSKWLTYSAILQWGSGNFFILSGAQILGPWSSAIIKIMQNTMGVFHILFIGLDNILPQSFAKIYKKGGSSEVMIYFKKHATYGILLFSGIALIVLFLSKFIISRLYGTMYLPYAYLLNWFILIYLLIYMTMLQRYILRTFEDTKIIFYSYIITSIFSILSANSIIHFFKINGIIFGLIVLQLINFSIFHIMIKNSK
jgi:O-antigen/teichoic acid export membrane protein